SAPVPTSPSRTAVSVGAAMAPYYTRAAPAGRAGFPRGRRPTANGGAATTLRLGAARRAPAVAVEVHPDHQRPPDDHHLVLRAEREAGRWGRIAVNRTVRVGRTALGLDLEGHHGPVEGERVELDVAAREDHPVDLAVVAAEVGAGILRRVRRHDR